MKKIMGLLLVLMLAACAKDKYVYLEGDPTPPAPVTQESKIAAVVSDENQHRFLNAQSVLTQGLVCSLYSITGGQTILAGGSQITGKVLVATYVYKGEFNQPDAPVSDGMNVLPEPFKSIYKNLYYLTCSGQIVVTDSNHYEFTLASDDGSLLYLDGSLLISNDGNHGTVVKIGTKYLKKGVHTFRLDYAQTGSGGESLMLSSGGSIINPMYFYR